MNDTHSWKSDFVFGAKRHPGWLIVFFLWMLFALAGFPLLGLIWFAPVLATCIAVGRANRGVR